MAYGVGNANDTVKGQPQPKLQLDKLLLKADEVAAMLGLTRTTIFKLGKAGEIGSVRIMNKAVRFPRVAVEQYVARLMREQGVEVEG